MTPLLYGALHKFSVSADPRKPHVRSVQMAQELVVVSEVDAVATNCRTTRLFNYRFFFGSEESICALRDRPSLEVEGEPWRHFEAAFDSVPNVGDDLFYASWLLAVAHLPISKRADRNTVAEELRQISMAEWLKAFHLSPPMSQIEATFRPTILVKWGYANQVRPRVVDELDVQAFEARLRAPERDRIALCLLDGDGIKKTRREDGKPSLYAMHQQAIASLLPRIQDDPYGSFRGIYEIKLGIDGLFDEVVGDIIGELRQLGFLSSYIGGDEVLIAAPEDAVRSATEKACARAPFQISFSCGLARPDEFAMIDDGLRLAEARLTVAKERGYRNTFNIAERT